MWTLLQRIFTWWNGQTAGTWFFTLRKGILVGTDENGNHYYRERNGKRRWVTYNGVAEASTVPAKWHGWLHYTVDTPPTEQNIQEREWQKPHRANMTGTPQAWRPQGSLLNNGTRPKATGDYEPWQP